MHQDAPLLPREEPGHVLPAMRSILLPPEIAEIAASAVKPMGRKKRRQLEKSAQPQSQQGENLLSAMASSITDPAGHR